MRVRYTRAIISLKVIFSVHYIGQERVRERERKPIIDYVEKYRTCEYD